MFIHFITHLWCSTQTQDSCSFPSILCISMELLITHLKSCLLQDLLSFIILVHHSFAFFLVLYKVIKVHFLILFLIASRVTFKMLHWFSWFHVNSPKILQSDVCAVCYRVNHWSKYFNLPDLCGFIGISQFVLRS